MSNTTTITALKRDHDARHVEPSGKSARGAFIRAMRAAVTGVNVVTTDGPAGRLGLTVSAFSPVSAEPPMVLICINRRSPVRDAIVANEQFCVNVLSTEQRQLADTFSGQVAGGLPYDFAAGRWQQLATGAPALVAAVARFDCKLSAAIPAASHTILIGRAVAVDGEGGQPLLYTNRDYGHPCR